MSETKIPGLKAAHRIVTPQCIENKGQFQAMVEAVETLEAKYSEYFEHNPGANFHFVLTIEQPSREEN